MRVAGLDDRVSSRVLIAGSVLLAVSVATAAAAVHWITGRFWLDLEIYRQAGAAVLRGSPLYELNLFGERGNSLEFVYPPFAALVFVPLALLGEHVSIFGWTLVSMLALEAICWLVLDRLGVIDRRHRAASVLAATVLALPLYPIANTMQVGQINLLLILLVLADLLGVLPGRWRGVGVGIAAGLKLTSAIFAVYLLLTGRARSAARAAAAFLATVAVGFVALPAASATYWGGGVFLDHARITADPRTINNQSLHGALTRVFGTDDAARPWWLTITVLVTVAGLAVAAAACRRDDELAGILACAVTGLLISPVSWHHHWAWFVPLLLVLAVHAVSGRSAPAALAAAGLWLVLAASDYWMVVTATGRDLVFHGWLLVFSNAYVLLGLAALAAIAVSPASRPDRRVLPERLPS